MKLGRIVRGEMEWQSRTTEALIQSLSSRNLAITAMGILQECLGWRENSTGSGKVLKLVPRIATRSSPNVMF